MNQPTDPLTRPHPRPLGTVVPWPEIRQQWPPMTGDESLVRKNWEGIDAWSYAFLWHCVVSF